MESKTQTPPTLRDLRAHLNVVDGELRNAMRAALDIPMDDKFMKSLSWSLINALDLLSQLDETKS